MLDWHRVWTAFSLLSWCSLFVKKWVNKCGRIPLFLCCFSCLGFWFLGDAPNDHFFRWCSPGGPHVLEVPDQVSSQPSPAGEVVDAGKRSKFMDCLSSEKAFMCVFCHAFPVSISTYHISTYCHEPFTMQQDFPERGERVLWLEQFFRKADESQTQGWNWVKRMTICSWPVPWQCVQFGFDLTKFRRSPRTAQIQSFYQRPGRSKWLAEWLRVNL